VRFRAPLHWGTLEPRDLSWTEIVGCHLDQAVRSAWFQPRVSRDFEINADAMQLEFDNKLRLYIYYFKLVSILIASADSHSTCETSTAKIPYPDIVHRQTPVERMPA
jgi:hypothetical protein